MDNHHILGPENAVDGFLLCLVKIGESNRLEGKRLRRYLCVVEKVAEVGKTIVAGFHYTVERIEHHLVTRLIERELYP